MFLNPIQNSAVLKQEWVQSKPVITQRFGERPEVYKQFSLKGHDGIDLRAKEGTPLFAPMDGIVDIRDSGNAGYGKHVVIRNPFKAIEMKLAHLSEFKVVKGQNISTGDFIGLSGNSGFSSAPHLHWCVRLLKPSNQDVWKWEVLNANNGYSGYFDFEEFVICWKGNLIKNNL